MQMRQSAAGVTVFTSALYQTNSTVVETRDAVVVCDPAWLPDEVEAIRAYVDRVRGERELVLVVTHSDFDHVIGCGAFTDARVVGSKVLAEEALGEVDAGKLADGKLTTGKLTAGKLAELAEWDARHYIQRTYEAVFPLVDEPVGEAGKQVWIGNRTLLTGYPAPGHTASGLFVVVEEVEAPGVTSEGAKEQAPGTAAGTDAAAMTAAGAGASVDTGASVVWLAGDYLSDFELPFVEDSVPAYVQTLATARQLLQRHDVKLLVPGHGVATADAQEMLRRIEVAEAYLRELEKAVRTGDEKRLEQLRQVHAFASKDTDAAHALNVLLMHRAL